MAKLDEKALADNYEGPKSRKPRVLFIDIETSYAVGTFWGNRMYKTDIIHLLQPPMVIMVGWKWHGDKKAQSVCLKDFKGYKPGLFNINDKQVAEKAWELLDSADLVIGQNSDAFDIRLLNARFWHYGMKPPSGFDTGDTKKRAKKVFYLPSYKLNEMTKYRGLPQKKDPGGIGGWDSVINEGTGWDKMGVYCRNDVEITAELWESLSGWGKLKNIANLYTRVETHCPEATCMSREYQKRGVRRLKTGWRQEYQCINCGTSWRGELMKEDPKLNIFPA